MRWSRGLCILLALLLCGCFSHEQLYYVAPTLVPGTLPDMNTAGFWIHLHPSPDELILNEGQIKDLNAHIRNDLKYVIDLSVYPSTQPGDQTKGSFERSLQHFIDGNYYVEKGRRASAPFFRKIRSMMDLEGIPLEVKVRFGLIVQFADQRIFPVREGLYALPGDLGFDELQNSALDIGTPLAILHTSSDKKWYYAVSSLSAGWIEVDKVAFCSQNDLREFLNPLRFVIVTRSKGDLFLNSSLVKYHGRARMGNKFPLRRGDGGKAVEVTIPSRRDDGTCAFLSAFLNASEIHIGPLPYTPRSILQQAFELLNAPYGWGGMYGEQDCSRFIHEIFSTVGIMLPRNSSAQAQVGKLIGFFDQDSSIGEKLEVLSGEAIGGMTFVRLKGHIMLFLGTVKGRPYVIHEIWGYRQKTWKGDRVRVINRVVVTDLSLGKGSEKGSLLERIDTVRIITQ